MIEILSRYPIQFLFVVLGPFLGGFVGAYMGYDNLRARLQGAQQHERMEDKLDKIRVETGQLSVPIETIRHYETTLQSQGQEFDVLRRLLSQYEQLKSAVGAREQFIGKRDSEERLLTAEYILKELQTILGATQFVRTPLGQALVIKVTQNTFRVTFPVPMRIPPALTFSRLPEGVEAHVLENSAVGFSVVFTPNTILVETFGFQVSAEP